MDNNYSNPDPNRGKLFHSKKDRSYIKLTSQYSFLDLFTLHKPKFPVLIPETVLMNIPGGGKIFLNVVYSLF